MEDPDHDFRETRDTPASEGDTRRGAGGTVLILVAAAFVAVLVFSFLVVG